MREGIVRYYKHLKKVLSESGLDPGRHEFQKV